MAVQIILRFQGKKPGAAKKLSLNLGKVKDKDSTPEHLRNEEISSCSNYRLEIESTSLSWLNLAGGPRIVQPLEASLD